MTGVTTVRNTAEASSSIPNETAPAMVQVVHVDGVEITFTAPPAAKTAMSNAPAPEVAETPSGSRILNQVSTSLAASRARGSQEVVIRLAPPELGRIRMSVASDGKELRAMLEVDNPRTFEELHRQASALVQRMMDVGLNIKGIDISLNDPDADDQQQADGSETMLRDHADTAGQHGSGDHNMGQHNEQSAYDQDEAVTTAAFTQHVTDQSIDVLM